MLATVRTYISSHALLQPEAPVLVGLSGGADSVCLLHVLRDLGYQVIAAHCNFQLRGEESDRDEHFVRTLCEELNVPLFVQVFRTASYASQHSLSIEMAARELRYTWFGQLREQTGCQAICVAHHKNDQAETLLLNLKRGTGVRGLAGMKPRNGFVVRPLLCVSRAQILAYCREQGYAFVTDSTNADTTIRRNAIRAMLTAFSEDEIDHMAHTAELLRQYDDLLEALLQGTQIDAQTEPALLYELLQPYGFNATQVSNILSALPSSGRRFEAQDFTAVIDHGELRVTAKTEQAEDTVPQIIRAYRPRLSKEHFPAATDNSALFDADLLPERLTLRHWREGDVFLPITNSGKPGKKKLQDFFSDLKLSVAEKNRVWLLCNADQPEEIIWIIGLRMSNTCKITDSTTRVAELEINP